MKKRTKNKAFKAVGRALKEYSMIESNDRILVALSGGVDSLVLLDILARKREILPINYTIIPLHVVIDGIDRDNHTNHMEEIALRHGLVVEYRRVDIKREAIPAEKSICHICAIQRRSAIFKAADELQCGKLAMGHHGDDAVETLIMNMAFNGTISSFPGSLSMFHGNLHLIRPLILSQKKDILHYAQEAGIPTELPPCPHEEYNNREKVRLFIDSMEEIYPRTRSSLMASMKNINKDYLP